MATSDIYPWITAALEQRALGIEPYFEQKHYCHNCNTEYLCPDRYTEDECGPTRFARENWGRDSYAMMCSACCCSYDEPNRTAWHSAHDV